MSARHHTERRHPLCCLLTAVILAGCNISAPVVGEEGVDASRDDAIADLASDVVPDTFFDQTPDTSGDLLEDAGADQPQDIMEDEMEDQVPDVPIVPPVCGDGLINLASEQCDDGNLSSMDGCARTCQIEDGFVCPTPGAPCARPTSFVWDAANQRVAPFPAQTAGRAVTARCDADEYVMQMVSRVEGGRMVQTTLYCSKLQAPEPGDRELVNTSPNGNSARRFGLLPTGSGSGFSSGSSGHIFGLEVFQDTRGVVVGLTFSEGGVEVVQGRVRRIQSTVGTHAYGNTTSAASSYISACDSDELPYGITGYVVDDASPEASIHRIGVMCTKVLVD